MSRPPRNTPYLDQVLTERDVVVPGVGGGQGGGGLTYGTIIGIGADTLSVNVAGRTIVAAKPPALRASYEHPTGEYTYSAYANNYNTRQATSATETLQESITVEYRVGDSIFVMESVNNGTGVDDVHAVDINVDARAWAVEGVVTV